MAETIEAIETLDNLPSDEHWFCPRTNGALDNTSFYDEDVLDILDSETEEEKTQRQANIQRVKSKQEMIFQACQILAFDGADAVEYSDKLKRNLVEQLTRCSVCVRQYHRMRNDLQHKLSEDFDDEQVGEFMHRYDRMNNDRICSGLDSARDALEGTPPEQRKITALKPDQLFALFETMHCMSMLKNEDLLRDHFDLPFRLVQTKSKISLPEYTPALTAFLFTYNEDRRQWAMRGWKRFKRGILGIEFDHTVGENIKLAAGRIGIAALEKDFMPIFWLGLKTIVEKLDQPLITHHFRAMDVDVCKLALDHMHVPSDCFKDLLSTLQILLEKSPGDVWDAFGAISPQTVMEQIFNSPNLDQILTRGVNFDSNELKSVLDWIDPFIASIKPPNMPPACRSLLHQLWIRFQNEAIAQSARDVCYEKGLDALSLVLQAMNSHSRQAGGAALAGMLDVVKTHMPSVMRRYADMRKNGTHQPLRYIHCEVVEHALTLDCTALRLDREAIVNEKPLGHGQNPAALDTWKAVVHGVGSGDVDLASAIIKGARRLLALEPLSQKQVEVGKKPAAIFNEAQGTMQSHLVDLLEAMQDFEPLALEQFFSSHESAIGFISLLFFDKKEVQQTAAAVIKAVTSESSRRDAIRVLISKYYTQTLQAMADTMQSIARLKVFMPSMMVLKIGTDFLESLCNSGDGVLRTRTLTGEENRITEAAWKAVWLSISTIFENTENWSNKGHDKNMMIEFCRDSMDFADQVFDKYSVFAGALHNDASSESKADVEKGLLEAPKSAAIHIVKWLRLRDNYLIEKAVTLATRLMSRLEAVDMELSPPAIDFINNIVSGNMRHKLNTSQKAQLRRALESHLGYFKEEEAEAEAKQAHKQSLLSGWVSGGVSAPIVPYQYEKKKTSGIDMDSWKSAAAKHKSENEEHRKLMADVAPGLEKFRAGGGFGKPTIPAVLPKAPQRQKVDAGEFRAKRLAEQEARKKANAAIIAAAKRERGIGDAGSGLAGIGVEGKDHTTKGEGVMVSSDESEDDDDEIDQELFGGSKTTGSKRKNTVKADAAGVVGLKPEQKQGPVRIQRQIRSHKDMRARLQPDLSALHKTILGWDFFHEGEYPPNAKESQFSRVANSFRHVKEYTETFKPLLQLEAWQGFVRSREENTFASFEVKVVSRSSVDAFIEISTSISHAENREIRIAEGDILLFSSASKPASDSEAPHCLSRVYKINRKKQALEVIYRVLPGNKLNASLTPGAVIYASKIQSITPLEREYGALEALQYYDLCDEIIKAKPSPLLTYTDRQLEPLMNNYTVNKAQARAIRSAIDNDAFTLIQGPPGSGKTKTIVAIVGGLLSDNLSSSNTGIRIDMPKSGGAGQSSAPLPKKLMVCAPSNAAVDELVMRFKDGIKTVKGVHKKINVLRLGRSEAINSAVVDVTLDELVKKRMGDTNGDNNAREKTQVLMKEHQKVSGELRITREKMDSGKFKGEEQTKIQDEFHQLRRRKQELGTQIDNAKDAEGAASRTVDLERRKVQQAILDESHVICATLSGSGHELFQSLNIEFETVVVDEAAQCVEMSALIPLKYGCAKCILVGDPKQLPPTVFSKEAARFQYEQSLFVRMQTNFPSYVHLLDTQYRMHPDISAFPSATFYDGKLLDGDNMAGLREKVWHKSELLAPYRFFDVKGQHQTATKGHSLINRNEIKVAMALYERLTRDFQDIDFTNKIGIITPYKSQLHELKEQFSGRYGSSILESVEFNTTDAFQGRESEVIIFSCVRASPAGNVGFLQDIRRMNVGLTRAKSSLWVLGNSQSLMRGQYWKKLIVDAQERDAYTTGDVTAMLQKPSSAFPAKPRSIEPKRLPQAIDNTSEGPKSTSTDLPNHNSGDRRSSNSTSVQGPGSAHADRKPTKRPTDLPLFQAPTVKKLKTSAPGSTDISVEKLTKVKSDNGAEPRPGSSSGVKGDPSSPPTGSDAIQSKRQPLVKEEGYSSSRTATPQPAEVIKARETDRARSNTPVSASENERKQPPNSRATPQASGPPRPRKRAPADPFMPKAKAARR